MPTDNDVLIPTRENVTQERIDEKVKKPPMWRNVLHNDEITHGLFVIQVLATVFNKSMQESMIITQKAHLTGAATIAILPKDIAIEKAAQAMALAKEEQFPLLITAEEEHDED